MKIKAIILTILIIAVLTAGCDTAQQLLMSMQKPTAQLNGVQFGDVDLQSATLLFDVQVDNPYPVALPLLNMDYAIASNGNSLFEGAADLQTTIPAKGSQSVTLPIQIGYREFLSALANFKDIRPGSTIPYSADVGLSLDTEALGPLRLPLNKSGQLTIPEMPSGSQWLDLLNQTINQ